MSSSHPNPVEEEGEPQAKKQKSERAPLIVLNNDPPKKKQLTLKEIVALAGENKKASSKSPRPSPKSAITPSSRRKRKSNFEDDENTAMGTPVKQLALEGTTNVSATPPSWKGTSSGEFDSKDAENDAVYDESMVIVKESPTSKPATPKPPKQSTFEPKQGDQVPATPKQGPVIEKTPEKEPVTLKQSKLEPKQGIQESIIPKQRHDEPVTPKQRPDEPVTPKQRSDEPVTPKQRPDEPVTPKPENKDVSISMTDKAAKSVTPKEPKVRTLTPKQKKLAEEREKKRLEREEEKKAKEKARELEKKAREAAKIAEKEAKDKARELEKKQREETKKQKDAVREAEKQKREAEKQKREAERLKKQQEKEEEKRLENEKKLREQEKFKSFFTKKPATSVSSTKVVQSLEKKFRDFVITSNMAMAPLSRVQPTAQEEDVLSKKLEWESDLEHIKTIISDIRSKEKTATPESISIDLEIIAISCNKRNPIKVKRKILSFHENYRPAYNGSWRKKSSLISARRPFAQDKSIFDYDYDSDDDWEEEVEGEDITCEKEDEKEEEKDEEDEDDDGFFVPHGYLSDDEGDEDCDEISEEAKKKRLERRRRQFEEEQKNRESGVLVSKIVGPVWLRDDEESAEVLLPFRAVFFGDHPDCFDPFEREQPVALLDSNKEPIKKELPIEGYKQLLEFMHGSPIGLSRAVENFQAFWNGDEKRSKVSKRQLTHLIPTLMKKSIRPGNPDYKMCWYAEDALLRQHELSHLEGLHMEAPLVAPATLTTPSATLHNFKILTGQEAFMCTQQTLQESNLAAQQKLVTPPVEITMTTPKVAMATAKATLGTPKVAMATTKVTPPKHSSSSITNFLTPKTLPKESKSRDSPMSTVTEGASVRPDKRRLPLIPVARSSLPAASGGADLPENPTGCPGAASSSIATGAARKPRRIPLIPVRPTVTVDNMVTMGNGVVTLATQPTKSSAEEKKAVPVAKPEPSPSSSNATVINIEDNLVSSSSPSIRHGATTISIEH